MGWVERAATDRLREWERDDGHVTIRARRRTDGDWVVRLDRLVQAPEGDGYRHERVGSEADATAVAASWRDAYDADGDDGRSA